MGWRVFYYQSERGESPIEQFLNGLSVKARAKCLAYIDELEEHAFNMPSRYIKKVESDLWELRPEFGGTEYRFFYFALVGRKLVIVHAITKKDQKLKAKDIKVGLARIADVRRRQGERQPQRKEGQYESQISPALRERSDRDRS